MRFISPAVAPIVMGLTIMSVMISGIPIIVLVQKMPFDSPQFWTIWRDLVSNTAPYAMPMAITTAIIARLIVGRFTIKPDVAR
ncbi:MAG: hypothetical protein JKY31_10205 [Rhodobacteraceae bacterium]|nr:hypothetical protein [Paracoccaceae bacterium]